MKFEEHFFIQEQKVSFSKETSVPLSAISFFLADGSQKKRIPLPIGASDYVLFS
ncbi:hypothetical protein D3C86_662280 [compost metagenome]